MRVKEDRLGIGDFVVNRQHYLKTVAKLILCLFSVYFLFIYICTRVTSTNVLHKQKNYKLRWVLLEQKVFVSNRTRESEESNNLRWQYISRKGKHKKPTLPDGRRAIKARADHVSAHDLHYYRANKYEKGLNLERKPMIKNTTNYFINLRSEKKCCCAPTTSAITKKKSSPSFSLNTRALTE